MGIIGMYERIIGETCEHMSIAYIIGRKKRIMYPSLPRTRVTGRGLA